MRKFLLTALILCACAAPVPEEEARQDLERVTPVTISIETSATGEASLAANYYVVFDGSGSMRRSLGTDCRGNQQFRNKLEGGKWALREFAAKLPQEANVGLYVFDAHGRNERVTLDTNNRTQFLQAVNEIKSSGGTPLAESITVGTDKLVEQYKKQLGYGEYRLVVVTDGEADGIPQAARYATSRNIPIYAIGLCIGNNHPLRSYAASYRAADSPEDLARGLEETLAELPSFDAAEFEAILQSNPK